MEISRYFVRDVQDAVIEIFPRGSETNVAQYIFEQER